MVYKGLRIQYSIRIVVLLATAGGTVYWITQAGSAVLPVLAIALLLLQIYSLLHLLERPQRDILRFFEAIEFSDFSQTFSSPGRDKTLEPLRAAFDTVMQAFQKARSEKEAQYRYFQTVIQHIGIGILVFTHDGRIDLINQRAKRILGVRRLTRIDQLSSQHPALPPALLDLGPDEATQIQLDDPESGDPVTLSLRAARFILHNEPLTLVSLQNIQSELESKESEAWQNLIRVLTHEIMNSITPISSLAATANRILGTIDDQLEASATPTESVKDVKEAVRTIESRSNGLLKFVESYRKLTRIPKPEFRIVTIGELFDHVVPLMSPKMQEKGIRFVHTVEPETLEITADLNLVEQVLINLLQNAVDWAGANPSAEVTLRGCLGKASRPVIQVADNGPGIEKEAVERIFIPFFTTKQDGSGIGLSISRQIMRLHGGSISVQTTPGVETVFTLKF
jgi:nitrogen fixation/metabolism regulation signal transduction histidine kinase